MSSLPFCGFVCIWKTLIGSACVMEHTVSESFCEVTFAPVPVTNRSISSFVTSILSSILGTNKDLVSLTKAYLLVFGVRLDH